MKAVILAAGRGTRMRHLTEDRPKPMVRLGDHTLIGWVLEGMHRAGVKEILLITGYLAEVIEDHYGDVTREGMKITYIRQDHPDGTGSALHLAKEWAGSDPFFMTYGDIVVPTINYEFMADAFRKQSMEMLLSVNHVPDPTRGGAVYMEEGESPTKFGKVDKIIEKPAPGTSTTNWINAGLYVFDPLIFNYTANLTKSPRGEYELTDAIEGMITDKRAVHAYAIQGLWSDVGTPEILEDLEERLKDTPDLLREV